MYWFELCCLRSFTSVSSCVWLIPHCMSLGGRQIPPPSGVKAPHRPSSHPQHVSSGAPVTRTLQSVPQTWDFVLGSAIQCTGLAESSPEQSPKEAVLEVPQRDRSPRGSRGRSAILRAQAGWSELPFWSFARSPFYKADSAASAAILCHISISKSFIFLLSSVPQSCLTPCDPMNCSTPGLPVHHQLPEFNQTHVLRVGDAIQSSHPLLSPFPPTPNPSQHQSLFR